MKQDIPWETLIEGKSSLQKHPSPCIIQQKLHCNTTMEAFRAIATNQSIHENKHEYTHPMPCFQPSQMLPLANLSSLVSLNFFLFSFYLLTPTTTFVAAYIVASPTKLPSGIT